MERRFWESFVSIPPGASQIGDEHRRGAPGARKVRATRTTYGYRLLSTPVTQGMWEEIVGGADVLLQERALGDAGTEYSRRFVSLGVNRPMTCITYEEAEQFCKLASGQGRDVRLPTEVEWEHACRAGSRSKYHWGDDSAAYARFAWTCDSFPGGVTSIILPDVAQRQSNAWDVHDMVGLVSEWVRGRYRMKGGPYVDEESAFGSATDLVDWTPPEDGDMAMVRGCPILLSAGAATPGLSALRGLSTAVPELGFRVAWYD